MNVATKNNTSFAGLTLGGWRDLEFEYFRAGIDVHWLMIGETTEPTVAVLKYAPGSRVPRHRHVGLETIVVMDGTQSDENGDYPYRAPWSSIRLAPNTRSGLRRGASC